jgi:hypothetical protein
MFHNFISFLVPSFFRFKSAITQLFGVCGCAVGWDSVLEAWRSKVLFPMESLRCFTDLIFPAAWWLGVDSDSNRNEYEGSPPGGGGEPASAQGWQPYQLNVSQSENPGSLNLLQPSWPTYACTGTAFTHLFSTVMCHLMGRVRKNYEYYIIHQTENQKNWQDSNTILLSY